MDIEELAKQLYPLIRAQLLEEMREEHVHQYVITGGPRRVIERFEDVVIYVFFCEHCLDVKTKIKHIPRHGDSYWTTC
jgi:hypothetical protein